MNVRKIITKLLFPYSFFAWLWLLRGKSIDDDYERLNNNPNRDNISYVGFFELVSVLAKMNETHTYSFDYNFICHLVSFYRLDRSCHVIESVCVGGWVLVWVWVGEGVSSPFTHTHPPTHPPTPTRYNYPMYVLHIYFIPHVFYI
jgi:hypothetical protein